MTPWERALAFFPRNRAAVLDETGRLWNWGQLAKLYDRKVAEEKRASIAIPFVCRKKTGIVDSYLSFLAALRVGRAVFLGAVPSREEWVTIRAKAGDHCLALLSSGTEGTTRWVVHRPLSLFCPPRAAPGKNDPLRPALLVLDPFHAAGLDHFFQLLLAGRLAVLGYGLRPERLAARSARGGAKELISTPTLLGFILFYPPLARQFARGTIRLGCEPLKKELAQKVRLSLPTVRLHQFFGSTETWAIPTRTCPTEPWRFRLGNARVKVKLYPKMITVRSGRAAICYGNGVKIAPEGEVTLADRFSCRGKYCTYVGRSDQKFKISGRWVSRRAISHWVHSLPGQPAFALRRHRSRTLGLESVEVLLLAKSGEEARELGRALLRKPAMLPARIEIQRRVGGRALRRGKTGAFC